tara:strand:+ start:284 stop:721 length:438 start_codon:yes stop_codon:yes gene_type:complete
MNLFDKMGLDIAELLMPWIAVLISITVAFWFKDFVQGLVQGMKFRFNPAFNEGEKVILNDQDAIIVRIGLRETVFGVYSKKGYVWRYIPNNKIETLKLEKIINKDLHLDTDAEKGRRLQEMIDKSQSEKIQQNKDAIDNIKNGRN